MVGTRCILLSLILAFASAELRCEWEYKAKSYLSGWATNKVKGKKYSTLEEAQALCVTLGDDCGGITFSNQWKYSLRRGQEFQSNNPEQSWRKICNDGAPLFRVTGMDPQSGSRMGGIRITITGQGFSKNQLDFSKGTDGAASGHGNEVVFYHKEDKYAPARCNVISYYTSTQRIVCDLVKPEVYWDEALEYKLKISVDGTWMENNMGTTIYCRNSCTFWFSDDQTPSVNSVDASHVKAGSLITMNAKMWTAEFEATSGADSTSDFLSRIYLNSFTCDATDADGNSYGTSLDKDDDGNDLSTGVIKCKSSKPGATSYRPSFFHSTWGRSEIRNTAARVDSQMQKYAIQTYNEISSISPTSGSESGGTKITITSEYITGPIEDIEVQVAGSECKVESFSSAEIVCSTPAKEDGTLFPGNRGVTVEYWTKTSNKTVFEAKTVDPDSVRTMTQDSENFLFEKKAFNTYPESITDINEMDNDEPYYIRMRFYLNIQETDMYGFHMITDFKGKLFVSTDHSPDNAVLKIESTMKNTKWDALQTPIDTQLEAGKIYFVEFVGVLENYQQHVGVGLTKKTTPYQPYDVAQSRIDKPTWSWEQEYYDEIQEITLGGLIKNPAVGFKLKLGERETKALYASSTVDQIEAAITDTAVYKCPTLDDTTKFWYSEDFEERNLVSWRDYREPFCGRAVNINNRVLYQINYRAGIYEWDPTGAYKYMCFATKTQQTRINIYYELSYQDENYKWRTRGLWKDGDDMDELQDNDGTWKYNCINMEDRIKQKDYDFWMSMIGSRKFNVRKMFVGIDVNEFGEFNVDSIRISKTSLTEDARVKGFALNGEGKLETVAAKISYICDGDSAEKITCPEDKISEAVDLKWTVTMNTHACGYDFPLIGVADKKETVLSNNEKASYDVEGENVVVERIQAITPDLQGTFDLTIDGVTHQNIDVHGISSDLETVRQNGEYSKITTQGTCYKRQWQLERSNAGYFGEYSVDSANVIGVGTVNTVTEFPGQNLRGGLIMTPLYGDWIREVSTKSMVSIKVNGIQALCDNVANDCSFTHSLDKTPVVTSAVLSGTRDSIVVIPGSGFGTNKDAVAVTLGDLVQTITSVTDSSISVALTDGVSQEYTSQDIIVNIDGLGNAKVDPGFRITYIGAAKSVTPSSTSIGGGTVVTITGEGFDRDNVGVTFNSAPGEIIDASNTQIKVSVPAGSVGAANIAITGGSRYVAPDTNNLSFSWVDNGGPTATSIEPTLGSVAGGTSVKISGSELSAISDSGVTIGGVLCTKDDSKSSNNDEFFCITGPNSPGSKSVVLAKDDGERSTSSVKFMYILTVNSIIPEEGSVIGGTRVTVTGSGFGSDKTKLYIELGDRKCDVETVADDKVECVTEPAITADQLSANYKLKATCVGLTLTELEQTSQNTHNMYRRMHENTPDLCYSHEVAKTAKSWAKYLIDNNRFKPSTSSYRDNRGETLMKYEHWDLQSDETYINNAIEAWYSTGAKYSVDDPSAALDYTQVVWKLTSKVGCTVESKKASATEKYTVIVVCHYSAAGNVEGKFKDYVTDRKSLFHNTVKSLVSKSVAVNVFLDSRAAQLDKQSAPSETSSCKRVSGNVPKCTDNTPVATATFSYTYNVCQTPRITSVSPKAADGGTFWNEPITIVGSGFSTKKCGISVKIGEYDCIVQSSTATKITCIADQTKEPPVNTKLQAKINVYGKGDAIFEGDDLEEIYTYLKPSITSMDITEGSLKGGRNIVISGGGFEEGAMYSDGVTELEVLSIAWGQVTVRSVTGVPDTTDVTKKIVMTLDGVPVTCLETTCDFTYKVDKTPNISDVIIAKGISDAYTISITGSYLCGDSDQTMVIDEKIQSTCNKCNATSAECTATVTSSGQYSLEFKNSNGYANIPADKKTIPIYYEITEVTPKIGSIYGGTSVRVTGTSLPSLFVVSTAQDVGVVESNSAAEIIFTTSSTRQAMVATKNQIKLNGKVLEIGIAKQLFEFKAEMTPTITSISPISGTKDDIITITGSNLSGADTNGISVELIRNLKSGIACEGRILNIDCGDKFISLHQANYGVMPFKSACNVMSDGNPGCSATDSLSIVQEECDGKQTCTIGAYNFIFGDPCSGRGKYLSATWECLAVSKPLSEGPRAVESPMICALQSANDTEVTCKIPNSNRIGDFRVMVKVDPWGNSNSDVMFDYAMKLADSIPSSVVSGSLGGPTVQLQGTGFLSIASVEVCDILVHSTYEEIKVSDTETSDQIQFKLPACPTDKCPDGTGLCTIKVIDYSGNTLYKTDHVSYKSSVTPAITEITPSDAGTGGGKEITITGTAFSSDKSLVNVKFDGVSCTFLSSSDTQIVCKTGAKTDLSNKDGVEITISDIIAKNSGDASMTYMDKWSSKFTWGGDIINKPVEGDLAVIQKGQIVYLDESPPLLKGILLNGGHLVFDDNQDIKLMMEYMIIIGDGSLVVGTEDQPFQHNADIEMYGHQQSIELPMYGAKTIAVRHGTVEMHGKPVTPAWCELGETAEKGSDTIIVKQQTNWKVDDEIAISSSSFAPEEHEYNRIKAISYDERTTTTTIQLDTNLLFKHISSETTANGKTIKTAAKIGHLTRNVKLRGNVNKSHIEKVDACPQSFNPDQFATQTCFQGRYGEELDSDQFGSQIMFHAAEMGTREVHGRLENIEVTWAGQAFRLGRYPIHFHMNGDVQGSYVKGCAVHHTFNRAVTVHGVDNLLVENNVAYNNMGHAYFLEDGIEENNIFRGNLAIFTRSSSSLLNVDVTPASFWIVNPVNTFENNVAAGATHFGFWFNMPAHPGGPSVTKSVCPRNKGMLKFKGNEAHSCGRYGIWVWEFWNPRGDGSCEATEPKMTTLEEFHGWHNLRGVEIEQGSGIEMKDFTLHDNWHSQAEVHKCAGASFEEGNTKLTNSLVIAKTPSSDGLNMRYMGDDVYKCGTGVVIPGEGFFSVHNTYFKDFTECEVFTSCGGCRDDYVGGFPSEYKGIHYENSPNRGSFKWQFEAIMRDLDGSLSETNIVNGVITPEMEVLDKTSCSDAVGWNSGSVKGVICDSKTDLIRLSWNKPSLSYLMFKDVLLSNKHGQVRSPWVLTRLTHKKGWMVTVPAGYEYNMKWDTDNKFTNTTYEMSAYYPKDDDYLIINQELAGKPDYITVGGKSNKKLTPIAPTDDAGTFTFDDSTNTLSHLITGKGVTTSKEIPMDLKVYKCFYENCTDPHPKPLPSNPSITQRPDSPKKWSVSADWIGTEKGWGGYNGMLPTAGEDVQIPSSWWMIYDVEMEGLGTIFVYGVLEFSNEKEALLGANRIIVVGGKIVLGWKEDPLKVKATIKLTGHRDDKEYTMNDGTIVGSKALAIMGYAEMHSNVPDVLWSSIMEKAVKGSSTIVLKDNVEGKWKVGDEIAIASTSSLPQQAEKKTLTNVAGHTLTLDSSLEYDHDYLLEEIGGHQYERTAEVGLLTRLITIEGAEDQGHSTKYGARVLVSDYSQINDNGEREFYIPEAMIQGVEFKNSGQQGYREYFDPRYSLALQNTNHLNPSYVKDCSVNEGFNHGIGIVSSPLVKVYNNVIYATQGSGVKTNSPNVDIQGNVVINMIFYGNHENPVEEDNYFVDACFETYETNTAIVKGNNCGGSERACFSTKGGFDEELVFDNNVAHSCLWGIFIRKSTNEVSKMTNIRVWQNHDYGLLHWSMSSLQIENSVFADNGYSILPMIVGPNPKSHKYADKFFKLTDTLIYGRHPNSECSERQQDKPLSAKLSGEAYHSPPPGRGQGRLGMYLPSFTGGYSLWPKMGIHEPGAYPSIKGLTTLSGVTFANFQTCDDTAIMDMKSQGDLFHPIKMENIAFVNTDRLSSSFFNLRDPRLGLINPSDCVDMPCDARKKVLITDMDGSVLGKAGNTLISRSEFQWDSTDKRWGMGDYRLPNQMTTAMDGTKIPSSTWPYKGIDRNEKDSNACTFNTIFNMYQCMGIKYRMLVIESMDGDTEARRLSPVALVTDDGSVDLINGPMDHGWCGGYTCQERISTFYAMVIVGKAYKLYLTSTQPQSMRYMLLDAAADEQIRLDVWYAKSQRLDLYYQGKYIAPTNAQKKADGTYTYVTSKSAKELYPKIADKSGTNFFDSKSHWLSMVIGGQNPYIIKTSPKIVLSLTLEAVDGSDFFDEDKIIGNLAALLGVPKDKIKIVKVVSEGRRKRSSGQEFQVEISNAPFEDESSMDESAVSTMATELTKASEKLIESVQQGTLGTALEADVQDVAVEIPEVPPKAPEKMDKEDAGRVTDQTFAKKQAKKMKAKSSSQGVVKILVPDAFNLVDKSDQVEMLSDVAVRSMVVSNDGTVVPLLGAGDGKWTAQLSVKSGPEHGRLLGTKEVEFISGYGNLTDIRLSREGVYKLSLKVSTPTPVPYEIDDLEIEITEQAADSPLTRVMFNFDGDYSAVVGNDEQGFTTYLETYLKTKYPEYYFDDIDHYAGSVVVEATVSTSAATKSDTVEAVTKINEDAQSNGLQLQFNGQSVKLASFSKDTKVKSTNVVAIVVPVLIALTLVGAALGGYYKYSHRTVQVDLPVRMTHLTKTDSAKDVGDVYYNSAAADTFTGVTSGQTDYKTLNSDQKPTVPSERTENPLQGLRRRSLQLVWGVMNRRESQSGSPDYKNFQEIADPPEDDSWRMRKHSFAECTTCSQKKKTWPCPICQGPLYCSKECIDKDWPEHHTSCRPRTSGEKSDNTGL